MGSLTLDCPLCCGETFHNPQSLKYHLLSMTDNLYCPGCSERLDSVLALIRHLDSCGQSSDLEKEAKSKPKKEKRGSSKPIEVLVKETHSENEEKSFEEFEPGDHEVESICEERSIKVEKPVNEVAKIRSTSKVKTRKIEKVFLKIDNKSENSRTPDPLMEISNSTDDEKFVEKNVIAILPDGSEILNDEVSMISMDHVNVQEIDESRLMRVKDELCEESDSLYSCSSCSMSFNSVLDHIKQYHDGQEVVLEMAEQQYEELTTPNASNPVEESNKKSSKRPRQAMNTLRTEECIDSEGRLYTRKVVQIERFWDPQPVATKSSMIEKFFSNAEGVKVREKKDTPTAAAAANRIYRCSQCLEQFPKLSEFRMHTCIRSSKICNVCDLSFVNAKALQAHMKIHESEDGGDQPRSFVCGICGTEFSSHKSLRLHSRMHAPVRARHVDAPEGTQNLTFNCHECGKTFSESYRAVHMAVHTGDSVTCSVCNRKFDSADSLAMHAAVHLEANHHPQSPNSTADSVTNSTSTGSTTTATMTVAETEALQNLKPYQCQHCGRRFTRPHEKVKHERIHTGEKPHACEVCGKTFRVSYCLTLHMRTHTGVRPYACQHCGKRFKASSVYNHHLLTHGDVRAYTCPYCPKTFKTRVQLAGHKNSHTKPFHCTECSRPFASLYAVRAHIETHKKDNNLKFSCYICGASYGRAFALKDHLKQHGTEVQPTPEPSREEEVQEGEEFVLADEGEIEEEEMVIPSPLPVQQSSGAESE
ncbi:zinc finger protein 23-like isoform X2 [Belonocnema kinseyi]|uniref:zinc finger protein 23-like isoform X2 n=1 Tax=Belonocnema kinseyi TaxID=2817044 RepID=UPI00143D6D51|nr:zinc finger protein 23-like isoform X2 [Belonocnema kinseyi]